MARNDFPMTQTTWPENRMNGAIQVQRRMYEVDSLKKRLWSGKIVMRLRRDSKFKS